MAITVQDLHDKVPVFLESVRYTPKIINLDLGLVSFEDFPDDMALDLVLSKFNKYPVLNPTENQIQVWIDSQQIFITRDGVEVMLLYLHPDPVISKRVVCFYVYNNDMGLDLIRSFTLLLDLTESTEPVNGTLDLVGRLEDKDELVEAGIVTIAP